MKKTLQIFAFAAIALAALASCVKEQFNENTIPAGEKIQVSINGLIGELTPADATKATAGSVVRVTWETGDEVYVYDGTACIGTLTVTPDEKNASYAMLSGTITASTASPAPTKLTLVYVKDATKAPDITEGKISIGLSNQNKAEVPFVLYTTIDYDKDALTKTNEYISFSFATSVMTVNCTGLQTGTGNAVTKAEIKGVSTACELAVTGSGVTVAGASKGTITRSETANPSVFTQSDSRGSFRLAIAADPAAPAARNILVHQGSKVSGAPFTSATLAGGQSYNTVYQLSEYKSDGAGGYAPVVKVTGVSLNKDKTTIEVDATEILVATVAPAGAANQTVNWLSSDEAIASVDTYGKVTGKSKGSAVITATTTDGNFTAFCLVTVPPVPVSSVSLDQTKLTLCVGSSDVKLTATVAPQNADNKTVSWSSDNTSVATVNDQGYVHAVALGTANITATTEDGNFKAFCLVTVSPTTGTAKAIIGGEDVDVKWVQLWAGGPKFAEYNVGAENNKAEDYGGYYTWGGTYKNGTGIKWGDDHNTTNTGTGDLSGDDDTATKLWDSAWRMPTSAELKALINSTNCTVEWIDGTNRKYNNTTVKGLLCTGKGAYASNSVFLPAAGYCDGGNVGGQGSCGRYWSSTPIGSNEAYNLYFNSGTQSGENNYRLYGFSVRAVLTE